MAIGFRLVKEDTDPVYQKLRISSQAYTLGDLAMLDVTADSIDVVPATSSTVTGNVYAVAMETVTSAATEALFCLVTPGQIWSTDSTNNSSANDNYQKMVVGANAHTINNTHTNSTAATAVFLQTGVVGATSDKRIVGSILRVPNVTA